jgi:hypothetical protein
MRKREEQLLAHLLTGGDDSAANELLGSFYNGYPVERLRPLLQSDNDSAVMAGAWIASELAERSAPLMNELFRLLNHPLRYVRFFILDAVLDSTANEHGEVVARAIMLIRDPDEAVRWKALGFLAYATKDQLSSALTYLDNQGDSTLLAWLLRTGITQTDMQEIITRLNDPDSLTRMFAVAAAARLGQHNSVPLEHACSFGEPACVREKSVNGLMNSPKNPGEALLLDQCSPTGGGTSGD